MIGQHVVRGWLAVVLCLWVVAVNAEPSVAIFAKVADEQITQAEYEAAVSTALRQRFYHGRVDDAGLSELRHQVAGELVERVLLRHEALRRGVKVDTSLIDRQLAHELARYRLQSATETQARHLQQVLRGVVADRLLLEALEKQVRTVEEPSVQDVRGYYMQHLDKFTTPSRVRLALILLKVSPSASVESWKAAEQEALRLQQKLAAGADFGALAELHSSDASAEKGGDLGFVHRGMLALEAQAVVDQLKVGEVSAPVNLLQGFALFKLLERQPEVVNPFERVSVRAAGLLQRELSDQAWRGVLQAVRANARLEIYDKAITTKKIWVDAEATKR